MVSGGRGGTKVGNSALLLSRGSPFDIRRTCGSLEAGITFSVTNNSSGYVKIADPGENSNGDSITIGLTVSFTRVNGGIILISYCVHLPAITRGLKVGEDPKLDSCLINRGDVGRYVFDIDGLNFTIIPSKVN